MMQLSRLRYFFVYLIMRKFLLLFFLSIIAINTYAIKDLSESATLRAESTATIGNNIMECTRDVNDVCISEAYHDDYIDVNNYPMNPYNHSPSGGGTQKITESDIANKGLWEQFFTNGTYNVVGLAAWSVLNVPNNNYAYGTNIFAQSGHINGFAVGGMLEVVNPFLQPGYRYLSGNIPYSLLPIGQVTTMSELYLEYQLPNHVQVDAGWILLETPWMNSYDDAMLVSAPFQGVVTNYQMTPNWRLIGIATNGYQEMGNEYFNQLTMYNKGFNGNGWVLSDNYISNGSYALGSVFKPSKDYELNLWGYSFSGYANTLYADANYVYHLDTVNRFDFGAQIGNQNTWGMQSNNMQQAGYGAPDSYLAGVKFAYGFSDWFNVELSYDGMFGPDNSFYQGGFVSPYTYTIVNDPLYTSGLGAGMIEQGAGNSWRIGNTYKLMGDDLKMEIAYEQFMTANPLNEWDLDIKYKPHLNGLKGLIIHWEADYATAPTWDVTNGGNFFFMETMVSYNY